MNNFLKSFVLHIKYPYTALIIAVMWVGMAILLGLSGGENFELLICLTSVATLIIAGIGFKGIK